MLCTGSIDKTSKIFHLDEATGRYDFKNSVEFHTGFVVSVCPMVNGTGFFTGGRDNKIMMMDLIGNPMQELIGHEQAVNSLA